MNAIAADRHRHAPKPGETLHRTEWCRHCDDMTIQSSKVLKSVPGTRMCASLWVCKPCGGYAE